jgi:hypothetical protein
MLCFQDVNIVKKYGLFYLRSSLAQGCPIFAKKKEDTMLEIIVTVGLYLGALALLVKGAVTFCDYSHE